MEPPWTPQKQPCKKWLFQSIGWWTKPIFAYRKYANEEIHQTSRNPSIGKKTNGLGFRCSLQGRASRYGLTEIRSAVGSARPRWCHEGWDPRGLRRGGEETISISRWVVELISSKISLERKFVVQQNTCSDSWMSLPTKHWMFPSHPIGGLGT